MNSRTKRLIHFGFAILLLLILFGLVYQFAGNQHRQKRIAHRLSRAGGRFVMDASQNVIELIVFNGSSNDLENIRELPQLRALSINNSNLDNLSFLRFAPHLTKLSFDDCRVESLSRNWGLPLNELHMDVSSVELMGEFDKCKNLQSLYIFCKQPDMVLDAAHLPEISSVTSLGITGCRILNASKLTKYSNAKVLSLYASELDNLDFIANFRSLTELELTGVKVKDYSFLERCVRLKKLFVDSLVFTEGDVLKIQLWLPGCKILRI